MEGRFGGAGGFGVDSVAEVPGEFVARLGPDGLAAGGACSAGGSAALDVVDVNQPLVLVEGVRHSDVGHLGSSPDVETLRWLRFLDGRVLAYRAGLDCDVSMCRSTAARWQSAGRFLAEW